MAERYPTTIGMISGLERPSFLASRNSVSEYLDSPPDTQKELAELEAEKLQLIVEILEHPELKKLALEGNITLGMIKPHITDGRNLPADQDEAAEKIIDEIGLEHIIFNQPFFLIGEDIDQLYEHVKDTLVEGGKVAEWDNMSDFMTSDPINLLLLYFPEGNAVQTWRNLMGPTMPNKAKTEAPNTIRGRHASELPNNIVHGSDSPESVIRELGLFHNAFQRLISSQ